MLLAGLLAACSVIWTGGCDTWNTTQPSHAVWNGGRNTFAEDFRPSRLDLRPLCGNGRDEEVCKVLEGSADRVRAMPSVNRAMMFADWGLVALHANNVPLAREMLDRAVGIMGAMTIEGEREKKVKSLTGKEEEKLFKGEPHERVMVYLYRGLLYMAEGDYDNAQACFKSALLQDALAEGRNERANWLTADLLLATCMRLVGDANLSESLDSIKVRYGTEVGAEMIALAEDAPRIIILVGVGNPPEKRAIKGYGEELAYAACPSRVRAIRVLSGSGCHEVFQTDDVCQQAVTRGRRKMDEILAQKAQIRKQTQSAGDVMAALAPLTGQANIVFAIAAELTWRSSEKIGTDADCRQMRALPGRLYLYLGNAKELASEIMVEALGDGDRVLASGAVPCPPNDGKVLVIVGRVPY